MWHMRVRRDLSPVPPCLPISLKEKAYEQRRQQV
jgi:hypothetical protein